MDINEILKKLPKIDIHTHLDGNIRPETILDIAKLEGIKLPTYDMGEFIHLVQVSPECKSLKEYLSKFPLSISVMQRPEYIYRITDEFLSDLTKQKVKYVELRWAPYNHFEKGMTFEQAVESNLQAMSDAKRKYGITSKLILDCMRNHSPETSIELVEKGKKYLGRGLVAIDLAGNETDYPPEIHKEAFTLAKGYGYNITVHAGETGIPQNIIKSVKELQAQRIGHGVSAYKDEEVFQFVKANKIPLEICIVSNIQTKAETYESHPVKRFIEEGIIVTLNTDSVTVSNTSLEDTYKILMDKKNLSLSDIKNCIMNAVEVSFTDKEEKDQLREMFLADFKKLDL